MNNSKGFTLVELAIVLVIIGVILGGVVKGTELVKSAKTKKLYREYQNIQTAYMTYFDRTGKIAGDADSNGKIDTGTSTFWGDLRNENLYSGNGETAPNNVFGGATTGTSAISTAKIMDFSDNNLVCFSAIMSDVIESIDTQFDDGVGTTGDIRYAATATTTAAAAYPDAATSGAMCIVLE